MRELVKEALSPAAVAGMARAVKGFGAGAGMGGAVGGVAGGALGAVKGYQDRREEGASIGSSIGGGLKGAWSGGVRGMALGAAAGGLAGAARPAYAEVLTPHLRGSSNFGQRQVQALTGVGDRAYVRSVGGGAADAERRLTRATAGHQAALSGGNPKALKGSLRELEAAKKGFGSAEKSEAMGLNSIPGYAKALMRDPAATLKTGIKDQWDNMGTGGRALMYGLPAYGVASELAKKPGEDGQGRLERAGRLFGAAASGMAAPLAIGGDLAFGGALTGAFGRLGRGGDRLLRRRPSQVTAAAAPDPAGGDSQAEAHIISDRAGGVVPEGING